MSPARIGGARTVNQIDLGRRSSGCNYWGKKSLGLLRWCPSALRPAAGDVDAWLPQYAAGTGLAVQPRIRAEEWALVLTGAARRSSPIGGGFRAQGHMRTSSDVCSLALATTEVRGPLAEQLPSHFRPTLLFFPAMFGPDSRRPTQCAATGPSRRRGRSLGHIRRISVCLHNHPLPPLSNKW